MSIYAGTDARDVLIDDSLGQARGDLIEMAMLDEIEAGRSGFMRILQELGVEFDVP